MISIITKRDGTTVDFDAEKLNKWADWSAGIGVEWGSVALGAYRKCFDGCTTDDLHNALIAECVDRETTAHLRMAGRLFIGKVYKNVFGDWRAIPTVADMFSRMVFLGMWENEMDYSAEELAQCEGFINHSLDMNATLTESKQIMDKYAIIDRVGKVAFETPQFVYMRMALGNMKAMPKHRRMRDVEELYKGYSEKRVNPPTPFAINLGTPKRQYASCCVVTTQDTIPSLAAADHIAYIMTAASAGIGMHLKTRSKGNKVRGGAIVHQGKLPYYKVQEKVVAANMQSSRGGANTMHFNTLDPEISDILKLKNVQTVADKQIKNIDYSFGSNALFAKKVALNDSWMLVSYGDAPSLYEAMYKGDQSTFEFLYAAIEADTTVPKEFVSARAIAVEALTEWYETGRLYGHNTDIMNSHTPFLCTIYSSNLCQEIGLPTSGYESVAELYKYAEGVGEIGLCSLGAIAANTPDEDYEAVAYSTLLSVDNVIEIMEYPFPQLEFTAKARRSVGIGITNLAFEMASKGLTYTSLEGKKHIHRLAERHSYWLHKASLRLAKERGNAAWMHKTKYPAGWLPIDTANREIDKLVDQPLMFDWEALRAEIIEQGGIRNSVLEAHMPCESSSIGSGHTNGLYPIRGLKVLKTSGNNKNLFLAPEMERLGSAYQLAWDIPVTDMIEVYAIIQKFTGQGISADFYIRYEVDNRQVGVKKMLQEFLLMRKLGLKTRYYMNSATRAELAETYGEEMPDCESCSL
jgi:ribonucleoside-diphosphate reductase alpha chain